MGRLDGTAAALIAACVLAGACDDPIVVTGDMPGLMTLVAGVGDSIGTRVDSLARRTRLTEPGAVAFDDATGILYIADRGSTISAGGTTRRVARVFAVRSDGGITLLLDGGDCTPSVCIQSVHSMIVRTDGSLLLTDAVGHRIFRLQPGMLPDIIAGTGTAGTSVDGTHAAVAQLSSPGGIVNAGDGRIIFTEQGANRVRAIRPDGTLETVAGTGVAGSGGDGGSALQAQLNGPAGLALSAAGGLLYIADRLNARVRSVSMQTGAIATVAGTNPGFRGDGGAASAAQLDRPESVAISSDDLTLFIADTGNDRVRAVDLTSTTISTFAGTGSTVFNGAGRVAGDTSLDTPASVTISAAGLLFIADGGHSAVWRTRVLLER